MFDEIIHGATELLYEVAAQNFVEATVGRIRVPPEDVTSLWQLRSLVPLLKELRQVRQLAVLHNHVEVFWRIDRREQGHDMGMMYLRQHADLGIQIPQELVTQLAALDGLNRGVRLLLAMLCQVDMGKAPLPDLVLPYELADDLVRRPVRMSDSRRLPS